MTMAYSRPLVAGSRPAYLDNLYGDSSHRDMPDTPPASLHSYTSSISTNSTASTYSLRSAYHSGRPLSPPIEECNSDSISIRSKKSFLSSKKRFRFGTILQRNRHTYPQATEELEPPSSTRPVPRHVPTSPSTPPASTPSTPLWEESPIVPAKRRPSLPKLRTSFAPVDFGPPEARSTYEKKALPALPGESRSLSQQPSRQMSRSKASVRRHASAMELRDQSSDLGCQKCYYYTARNCNGYVLGGDAGDACETCLSAGFFGAK
ncbi:hypothetical protein Slin15195_G077570 [Septoria linicola]|uniref:Uncharacterized protein n=1 Tax=Septoria linicola TaxID=215465 RepID=A0A9Q9EMH1_9PEZI|nr:hypothetical protein Slin14017_G038750 [Septoria linicola]USW54438.1 hypothetical protein Slin15195_G077570 [Septoria linicola]